MARKLTQQVAIAVLVALACGFPLAIACGPAFPFATFISEHPDLPLDGYAAGNLGVVLPSYRPSYLAVAYRYFENRPFSPDEQSQMVSAWNARLYAYVGGPDTSSPGANAGPVFDTYAGPSGQGFGFQNIPVCLEDAFETAEKTREDRIQQFGADSPAGASWLERNRQSSATVRTGRPGRCPARQIRVCRSSSEKTATIKSPQPIFTPAISMRLRRGFWRLLEIQAHPGGRPQLW